MVSMSRNAAHEALLTWASWYKQNPELRATRYDTAGRTTFDRASDDPRIPWRVLIVDGALVGQRALAVVATCLYMSGTRISRSAAYRRRNDLLTRVAKALSDTDKASGGRTISQAAIAEMLVGRRKV